MLTKNGAIYCKVRVHLKIIKLNIFLICGQCDFKKDESWSKKEQPFFSNIKSRNNTGTFN